MALTCKVAREFWNSKPQEFKDKYKQLYISIYDKYHHVNPKKYRVLTRLWGTWLQFQHKAEYRSLVNRVKKENKEALFVGHEDLLKL